MYLFRLLLLLSLSLCAFSSLSPSLSNFIAGHDFVPISSVSSFSSFSSSVLLTNLTFAIKFQHLDILDALFESMQGWQEESEMEIEKKTEKVQSTEKEKVQKMQRENKHWSWARAKDFFFDTQKANFVEQWVKDHANSAKIIQNSGARIVVELTLEDAEKIMQTEFFTFRSESKRVEVFRALEYKLHEDLAEHVEYVFGVVDFPNVLRPTGVFRAGKVVPNDRSFGGVNADITYPGYVSPHVLNSYYGIDSVGNCASGQTNGVFETKSQFYVDSDNQGFMTASSISITTKNYVKFGGNIPNNPAACVADNCDEAMLDIEYLMAIAQKATTTFYNMQDVNSVFGDFLTYLSGLSSVPSVISISYDQTETPLDPNGGFYLDSGFFPFYSASAAVTQNSFATFAQMLGLAGTTIVVSSGDDGSNAYGARTNAAALGIVPSFPASCPYVIAVGATQGPESNLPEIGASSSTLASITSGGGFSNFWKRPSWQNTTVSAYVASSGVSNATGRFNTSGRAYPDVALLGHNYVVVVSGQEGFIDGTSASAPVFAAMLTLINKNRASAGLGTLGFLNARLYSLINKPGIFNDITSGNSRCVAVVSCTMFSAYYFSATSGWDALTGIGSVNFGALNSALNGSSIAPSVCPSIPDPTQTPVSSGNSVLVGWFVFISLLILCIAL